MIHSPQQLASNVSQLVSFSGVAMRVDEMLADECSSATDIGKMIEQDPALTAQLMRIANSALFSLGVPVASVKQAVTTVGSEQIRNIILGISAATVFDGLPNDIKPKAIILIWPNGMYLDSITWPLAPHLLASEDFPRNCVTVSSGITTLSQVVDKSI